MASGSITPDRLTEYRQKGYTLVRQMFNSREIDLLSRSAKQDKALDDPAFGRVDGRGTIVRLSLWNQPGDTIYGMFARCESIVNSAEWILDGEVYHYHSKMIMKDAKTGGAWAWHQDYGYWYQNGVLAPDLCSAFIAVDPATRENGWSGSMRELLRSDAKLPEVDGILGWETIQNRNDLRLHVQMVNF